MKRTAGTQSKISDFLPAKKQSQGFEFAGTASSSSSSSFSSRHHSGSYDGGGGGRPGPGIKNAIVSSAMKTPFKMEKPVLNARTDSWVKPRKSPSITSRRQQTVPDPPIPYGSSSSYSRDWNAPKDDNSPELDPEEIAAARKKVVSLSQRQHEVLQQIMNRKSVFFTGAAGEICHIGLLFLLSIFCRYRKELYSNSFAGGNGNNW
jgi:hypothetical protein